MRTSDTHRNFDRVQNQKRTQCSRGHEFTPENTRFRGDGTKDCRECRRMRKNAYRKAQREGGQIRFQKPGTNEERSRALIRETKSVPCMDCGGTFHWCAMDFDHRDPSTKSFEVSNAIRSNIERVRAEIAKCDVVCSNCHRVRTYKRRQEIKKSVADSLARCGRQLALLALICLAYASVTSCGRGPAMPPQCNPAVNTTDGHQTSRCEQRR